jgi:hypothetical protein
VIENPRGFLCVLYISLVVFLSAFSLRSSQDLKFKINAKAEDKHVELLFLTTAEHHDRIGKFIRTKTEPRLCFMPAVPSPETEVR